ncbi:hypothetical protein psyc5s11_07390 [Clostridium gelidum]|uniref:Methyl-accepting chemotaxis protein n=1 Tax=Clostridium gelidum TaxID=704125 RepID=A0ABN6IWB0_9CLOT|nr:methyl-accepting chemotaxis protein [Clostridium gelidum]BCZ44672.1 hypothetical protein psyc5s11_07390 [Clostridium gelidum]
MNWFLNLKINKKLILSFVLISLITGIMGVYAIANIKSADESDTELYEHMTIPISQMAEISTEFQRIRVNTRDMIITQSSNDIEANIQNIKERNENITKLSDEFNKTIISENMRKQFDIFKAARIDYMPKLDKVIALAKENKDEEAFAMLDENGEAGKALKLEQDAIEKIVVMKTNDAKTKADLNTKNANTTITITTIIIIITMGIAIIIGISIASLITKPLKKVVHMIEEMSKGHFSERLNIDTDDEVGQIAKAMDFFADELKSNVIQVMNNISKGDVSMDVLLKDEKDELAPALKKMVENIRSLVMDVNMLSTAAIDGKFDIRADIAKHEGDFKKVINGVNGTLNTMVDKVVWYEAIIDAIPSPIHVTDNDMNWTYMNKSFENLMINQGAIRDRKSGYGLACSHAGANICNTEKCGIKQLHKGKSESLFDWCDMNNKQDTSYLKNKKGENIGYVEVITDLTPIIRVSEYTRIEVKRLEGNLKLLSNGNTNFDLEIKKADKFTDEVNEQFEGISNSLKDVKSAVDNLVTDANMVSNEATEGNLDARTDEARHSGDFKKIVHGINELMEAMVKPIKEVINGMREMAEGNLQISVNENYKGEFGKLAKSVNITVDSLNSILSELNTASEQVFTGSNQVSDASQALSQGATQQASAIEELNASMTDVAGQTKENANNANQAKELTIKVKENAEEGNRHMGEMLKSMSNINESSANISKIIKVIDEIAFQTNILALNAAVEAARAGQHGKGFAVVAEEVRNLAARSANAAKETTDLIEGSIKKIEKGTEITNQTAKALDEIVGGVSKVTTIVAEIAALSNEQASSISQINLGIEQVSQVIQSNSSTAEQSAAASEELSSQAELLKDMVTSFKLKNSNMKNGLSNHTYNNRHVYNSESNMTNREVATSINPKISLSDREFGKY